MYYVKTTVGYALPTDPRI